MVFALEVGSSRVSTTMWSSPLSYFTADSVMVSSFTSLGAFASRLTGSRHAPREFVPHSRTLLDHHRSGLSSFLARTSSDQLDDGGDAHAAADAERGQAALELTPLELVDQGAEDHRAR